MGHPPPMSSLFSPLKIRDVEFRNRVFVSPMCQYSAPEGRPTEWHLVHLGSRAVGGAGLVFTEATAVSHEGRISPDDTGIWNEVQAGDWRRIAQFVKEQGSVAGIQLAHAGRKASTQAPWLGDRAPRAVGAGMAAHRPEPRRLQPGFPGPEGDERG
jgi:2,4-dienoyl-CoA reductase-like NADH-dependent reductase (Old Yellow Enzyme family)